MRTLVIGGYEEAQVRAACVRRDRRVDPAVRRRLAEGWRRRRAELDRLGRPYSDGPLLQFEGIDLRDEPDQVTLLLSPTISYRDVVGLRARRPAVGEFAPDALPRPFSVMNVLVTGDRRVVLGWRDVGDWDPSWELSGGFARRGEQPFDASRNRLFEDFRLSAADLTGHRMLAVGDSHEFAETFALFEVETALSADAVRARATYARTRSLADEGAALRRGPGGALHPPSRIALALYREATRAGAAVVRGG